MKPVPTFRSLDSVRKWASHIADMNECELVAVETPYIGLCFRFLHVVASVPSGAVHLYDAVVGKGVIAHGSIVAVVFGAAYPFSHKVFCIVGDGVGLTCYKQYCGHQAEKKYSFYVHCS